MLSKAAITAIFVALLGVTSACPVPQEAQAAPAPAGPRITPQMVLIAAPGSAGCGGDPSCRTAEQAAPFIQAGFDKFGFNTAGEQAALLALMAFETGDFKFDVNVFPGRPGQGTRNMMTFPFVAQYALDTPEVSSQVASIAPGINANMSFDQFNQTPADTMNAVRALVLRDDLSFASAAWFLRTKCTPDIANGLASASDEAWTRYMTLCIGVDDTSERHAVFQKARQAYGL